MLEQKIAMGSLTLKNRLVMAPYALEKSDKGAVTEDLLKFYEERTKSGHVGLVVIENSCVHEEGRTTPNQLSCAHDEDIDGLSRLAATIHKSGAAAVIQFCYAGAAAKKGVIDHESVSPSGIANPYGILGPGELQETHAMTQEEIDGVVAAFAEAALRAKKAGFDGVELQSSTGYLLNQFFSPLTNHRTDRYTGQTVAGRIQLHREILAAIRKAVGAGFCLGIRIGSDYMEGGSTPEDCAEAAGRMEQDLDFLDVSGGLCFFFRPGHKEPGYFSDTAEAIKKNVHLPVILAGGMKTRQDAESFLRSGKADLIGFGRSMANRPSFFEELMAEERKGVK